MVNVECPGCGATYSVAEKRIPEQGLRMRCPKCSESFVVDRPKPEGEPVGLPRQGPQAATRRGHGEPALFDKGPAVGTPMLGGPGRHVASSGPPVPPPEKPPLFAPPKTGAESPDTDDVDAGFGEDGFGVIDLSLPEPPPPASFPEAGGDDLPMVAESDLPMAALPHDDLPLLAVDDLPVRAAPRAPAPPPAPRAPAAKQFTPHDDLPMAATSDLPMVVSRSDDLPMRALRHDDLPAVAQSNLPVPAARGGHVDLPVARTPRDLPTPQAHLPTPQAHLPTARGHGDLPVPAAGLPIPADQDLPLPSPSGDLPLPADFNFPTRIGMSGDDDIPLSDGTPPPRMRSTGRDTAPSAGNQARDDAAFLNQGQFPSFAPELTSTPPQHGLATPAPPPGRPDEVGREFEMEPASLELEQVSIPAKAEAPRVRIKPQRSRALRTTLIIIPAIAIVAGIVPYLLGHGPYAYFLISDSLNRADNERAFESFRDGARVQLDNDTAAEARAALEQARAQQNQMPRFEPMKGYAAYLAYLMAVRFGESQSKATGAELLANVPPDSQTEAVALARAAQAAADGRYPEARAQLDVLLSSKPDDLDALTLSGLSALAANDAKAAHERFTKAVSIAKTARTLYGLARAEQALGHGAEAEKLAEQVLSLSKSHAGARVLAATIRWQRDRRDERAVKLLEEALNDGAVRGAASASELVKAYSLLGTIHVSQGRYGAAEKAFAEALKLDAQSELALVGSGELFYAAGRYQEALARFEGAQRVNANSIEAAAGMAKSKLALERPKEALLALKELAEKTKHPLLHFWWGQIDEATGDRDAAEKAYRTAIAHETPTTDGVVQAYVALSTLLASSGKNDEAEKILQQASDKLPDNPDLQHARGQVALRAGRLDEAKQHFRRAIELDEKGLRARFSLAVTHRRAREYDEAARIFEEIAKSDPEFPGLALERGVMFEEMGQSDKALEMYNAALKKAPDDLDLKLRVASTMVLNHQPKQALTLLREVFKARPRSAEVNHFLGRAIFDSGDSPHEALRFLDAAVQLDANRATYHLFSAMAAVEAGKTDQASESVDKALALDQAMGEAYWIRGMVKLKRGKSRDALDDLKVALEKNPTLSFAYATMAMCFQDQSNAPSAEEAWRKAIALRDRQPDWHFRLGKLLWDRGAGAEAAEHLKKSVELSAELKQKPGWLWNANFLLGEALRQSDPKRALQAYRDFLTQSSADNAYRADAELAIAELEGKKPPSSP